MSCFVIIALPDFSSCLSANSFFSHCSDIVTNMLWKEWINLIITFLVLLKQQWERPEEFLYNRHLCSGKNYIIDVSSGSKGMWSLIELLASFSGSRNKKVLQSSQRSRKGPLKWDRNIILQSSRWPSASWNVSLVQLI